MIVKEKNTYLDRKLSPCLCIEESKFIFENNKIFSSYQDNFVYKCSFIKEIEEQFITSNFDIILTPKSSWNKNNKEYVFINTDTVVRHNDSSRLNLRDSNMINHTDKENLFIIANKSRLRIGKKLLDKIKILHKILGFTI